MNKSVVGEAYVINHFLYTAVLNILDKTFYLVQNLCLNRIFVWVFIQKFPNFDEYLILYDKVEQYGVFYWSDTSDETHPK